MSTLIFKGSATREDSSRRGGNFLPEDSPPDKWFQQTEILTDETFCPNKSVGNSLCPQQFFVSCSLLNPVFMMKKDLFVKPVTQKDLHFMKIKVDEPECWNENLEVLEKLHS